MKQNIEIKSPSIIRKIKKGRERIKNAGLDVREKWGAVAVVRVPKRKDPVFETIYGETPNRIVETNDIPFDERRTLKNDIAKRDADRRQIEKE